MNDGDDWPFELTVSVIFRDLDVMGHVNNAVYFTYMETVRTTFFVRRLELDAPGELPVIVAEARCTYNSALAMDEIVVIQMGVSRIGRRSFDLDYRMKAGDGRLVATARTAMVTYDYKSGRTIPIPPHVMKLLETSRIPSTQIALE